MVMGGEQGRDQECVTEAGESEIPFLGGESIHAAAEKLYAVAYCSWCRQTCTRSIIYIHSAEVLDTDFAFACTCINGYRTLGPNSRKIPCTFKMGLARLKE